MIHSPFSFNKDQVRVLLFRECDWRGRRLLFDSSAIEKSNTKDQSNFDQSDESSSSNSYKVIKNHKFMSIKINVKNQCGKPNADWKEIREMAFGSIAVSFCGTSFKVHWLNNPSRLLCSQVFLAPVQLCNSNTSSYSTTSSSSRFSSYPAPDVIISDVNSSFSETTSLNSVSISEKMNPYDFDMPQALSLDNNEHRFISQMSNEESSGYSSEPWHSRQMSSTRSSLASIFSDAGSQGCRKMSFESTSDFNSDYGRYNRRILMNLSTSFENISSPNDMSTTNFPENSYYTVTGASNVNGLSDGCMLKLRRNSEIFVRRKTTSGDALSSHPTQNHRSKRPRLAIAVSITLNDCMDQELFCSEHMALLESMLNRLRFAAEQAYVHRQKNLFNLVNI